MSEEKKEHQDGCCGTPAGAPVHGGGCGSGGGCGGPKKFICGLLVGAFIFAAGMWYAKSMCPASAGGCHKSGVATMGKMCPMGGNMGSGSMMETK